VPTSVDDIIVSSELRGLKDWEALIPTTFEAGSTMSGTESTPLEFVVGTTLDYVYDIPSQYYVPTLVSGSEQLPIDSYFGQLKSNYIDLGIDSYVGTKSTGVINTKTDFVLYNRVYGLVDVTNSVKLWTHNYADLIDTDIAFRLRGAYKVSDDTDVTANIWGTVETSYSADIFSVRDSIHNKFMLEATVTSGIATSFVGDIFSASKVSNVFSSSIFSTIGSKQSFLADTKISNGGLISFYSSVFSTKLTSYTIGVDARTRSLFVSNFYPKSDEYISTVSGIIHCDVNDYLYAVVPSGTYFKIDDTKVPTVLQPIANGFTVFCSASGTGNDEIIYTIHAENTAGDVLEEDFYFRDGRLVTAYVNDAFKPNQIVDVLIKTKNSVDCQATASESYYFKIRDLLANDIVSNINAIQAYDLQSFVKVRSKALEKGKTYTLTISGIKDYAGNYMKPLKYIFTVK